MTPYVQIKHEYIITEAVATLISFPEAGYTGEGGGTQLLNDEGDQTAN